MKNNTSDLYFDFIKGKNATVNLVFVHGSGCNCKFLRPLAKKFRAYNCYLPDLPDHGKSPYRNCQDVMDYVDAISDFVAGLENVILIGHSLGGTICLGVAARNLPSVKKCILISSGARFNKLDWRIHAMVNNKKINWGYLLKCLGSLYNPVVLADLLNFEKPDILLKDFDIDIRLNLECDMCKIKIPTLITVSREDILTIPEYSEIMHKYITGSKMIVYCGCKHMLPIAQRKRLSGDLIKFIETSRL